MQHLLPRHKQLCDAYFANSCNVSVAAKEVGLSLSYAYQVMQRPEVMAYIDQLNNQLLQASVNATLELHERRIASKLDLQEFWTSVLLDDVNQMKDRLKASELLGKSQGLFIDRQFISGANGEDLSLKVTFE